MATHHASVRIAAIRLQASLNLRMTYLLAIIYVEISMPLVPLASATPFAPDSCVHGTGVTACVRLTRGVIYGMES